MNKEIYDLEMDRVYLEIERAKANRILVQLPDGLKYAGDEVLRGIKEKFPKSFVAFWAGSCFGACDVPLHVKDFDLIIQFGHSPWRF